MKKVISVLLTICMLLGLSVNVFAEYTPQTPTHALVYNGETWSCTTTHGEGGSCEGTYDGGNVYYGAWAVGADGDGIPILMLGEGATGSPEEGTFTFTVETEGFSGKVIILDNSTVLGGTFIGEVDNYGTIEDGTFSGAVLNAVYVKTTGRISGGTFNGTVDNRGTIKDGTFSGESTVYNNNGTIEGGEFSGESTVYNYGTITKTGDNCGTFSGEVYNAGTIEGGTFSGKVTNDGTISGGTFSGEVSNYGTISGGTFNGGTLNTVCTDENEYDGVTVVKIHTWVDDNGVCNGVCQMCEAVCEHPSWESGFCAVCGIAKPTDDVPDNDGADYEDSDNSMEKEDTHTSSSDMAELIDELGKKDTAVTISDIDDDTTISKSALEKAVKEGLDIIFKGSGYTLTLPADSADFSGFKGNFNPYIDTDANATTTMKSVLKADGSDSRYVQVIKTEFSGQLPGEMELTFTLDKELHGGKVYFYYWNSAEKQFEEIPCTVNGIKLTVKLSHFSTYIATNEPIKGAVKAGAAVSVPTATETAKTNPETGAGAHYFACR